MKLKALGLVAAAGLCLSLPAAASSLILPAGCATIDCPGNQAVLSIIIPVEIQQVFDASLFSGIGGPITITGIALRPSTSNTATSGSVNLTVKAETTSQDADAGCTSFPTGAGCTYNSFLSTAGATTLFSGIDTISTTNTGTPRSFDYQLAFTTSFTYDPTTGQNLLLDMVIPSFGVTGSGITFDAIGAANRQAGTGAVETGISGPGVVSGLVVQLNYNVASSSTPEPGTLVLLGSALLGGGMYFRRRSRRQ